MADNKEAQLDKLEAEKQKHLDAIAKIDTQIDAIRAELRSTVLAQTKQQAAAYALTPEEIFGAIATAKPKAKAKNAKRGPAVVKYRDEHGNTWGGGKGPRPKWVAAIHAAGGDIEKYRVSDDASASPSKTAAQRLAAQGGKAPEMTEIPRKKSVV